MTDCSWSKKLLLAGLFFISTTGCGHRQGNVLTAQAAKPIAVQPPLLMVLPRATLTYQSTPPAIRFDYPACWTCCKTSTAVFTIQGPAGSGNVCPSLSLDIPKLPWHIPGMIPIGMVASGYVDDLRKNQIPDAVVKEQMTIKVDGSPARRIVCAGHVNGKPSIDLAVIMIHADHVYILSADSDDTGKTTATQTFDDAVASLKWK